jgi:hypothetical protein
MSTRISRRAGLVVDRLGGWPTTLLDGKRIRASYESRGVMKDWEPEVWQVFRDVVAPRRHLNFEYRAGRPRRLVTVTDERRLAS